MIKPLKLEGEVLSGYAIYEEAERNTLMLDFYKSDIDKSKGFSEGFGTKLKSAAHKASTAKMIMPPTLITAEAKEIRPIILLPEIFTRNATITSATEINGTRISLLWVSKSCNKYVANVRATRLSLMIIEKAMRRAAAPVIVTDP